MSFRRAFKSVAVVGFMLGMMGAESLAYAAFPVVKIPDNTQPPVTVEDQVSLKGNASCNAGCQAAVKYMTTKIQTQYAHELHQCDAHYANSPARLKHCYDAASNWATVKFAAMGAMATGATMAKVVAALDDDQHRGEKLFKRLVPVPPT